MLQELWTESFGNLQGAIKPEADSDDDGFLNVLGQFLTQEVFTGVDPATGTTYTTLSLPESPNQIAAPSNKKGPMTAEEYMALASANTALSKNGGPKKAAVPASQPEQFLGKAEGLVAAIATTLLAPLAMPVDALAIKAGFVPLPDDMFGKSFGDYSLAAEAYQAIPTIVRSDPTRTAAINRAVQLAITSTIPTPGGDVTWSEPTIKENKLALETAQQIARKVIEDMGGASCPNCLQLPCACGANSPQIDLHSVTQQIMPITDGHNLGIARGIAENVFIGGIKKRSAESLRQTIQGKDIELLHIPPKSLLAGALLGDWKQLLPAIVASVLPNETGRRGATISIQSKPQAQGGDQLVISMAEIGLGSTDTDTFPLNSLPSWSQNTLQSALSDSKSMRARWDKSGHGSTPEIGVLTITNPGNAAKQHIPLAVRFAKNTKTSSGGAGILSMAIGKLTGIQRLISDVTGKALEDIPLTTDDSQLEQHAMITAAQSLAENGMRPGVVAAKAQEILAKIFNDTEASPTLQNIASSVMRDKNEIHKALEQQRHDQVILQRGFANLQKALEYKRIIDSKQFISTDKRDVYFRSLDTGEPVPLSIVQSSPSRSKDWEIVNLPTKEVNDSIIETALNDIRSLSPSLQLWESILNGDVNIGSINRETIIKAMQLDAMSKNDAPTTSQASAAAKKRSVSEKAADNLDLLISLITPTRKSK